MAAIAPDIHRCGYERGETNFIGAQGDRTMTTKLAAKPQRLVPQRLAPHGMIPYRLSAAGSREANAWTTPVVKTALASIAFLANSNFNEKVLPGGDQSNIQQYIVLVAWLGLIFASYFRRACLSVAPAGGICVLLGFYALAVISVAWSGDPASGAPKAAALAITTFGAWRLARTVTLDMFIDAAIVGLFALNAVSMLLAILAPDIGVLSDYQHAGQWNGIFMSKQSLGIAGAVLLFLASHRLMGPSRNKFHAAAIVVAIVCVLGSVSRGGGLLAAVSILGLYLASKSRRMLGALAFVPFAMCLASILLIAYFVATGNKDIEVFDSNIDFTQRSYIWQHALSYFPVRPWFGFGLNGFWTLAEVKNLFVERHGWFLDNYHNGAIAILMETGVVGLGAFVVAYLLLGLRVLAVLRPRETPDPDLVFALLFTSLIFMIDLTETFFLRSTNMVASLLLLCFFMPYARRTGLVQPGLASAAETREVSSARPWRGTLGRPGAGANRREAARRGQ